MLKNNKSAGIDGVTGEMFKYKSFFLMDMWFI